MNAWEALASPELWLGIADTSIQLSPGEYFTGVYALPQGKGQQPNVSLF